MATPDLTAGGIMDAVAALLNDTAKQIYTYVKQIPYLKMAAKDLRELFELNNLPVTNQSSAIITLPAGTTSLSFVTIPALPVDLADIVQLWESTSGINAFAPVTRKEFIPHYYTGVSVSMFGIWAWKNNAIEFPSTTGAIDLKIDYIAELFRSIVDENSPILVINGESYLNYRTAALCAEFIAENKTRADSLNGNAQYAFDKVAGIENKSKQVIVTRHRPFRASYKRGGVR